jgi:hypothetical protein
MKQNLYKVLFLLALCLPLVCCKKNSEPAPASLVGTWTYVKVTDVATVKSTGATTTSTSTYTPNALKVTFKADGTCYETSNGKDLPASTYTYTGNALVKKGNIAGFSDNYTVSSLTATSLVFSVTDEFYGATHFQTYTLSR